MWERAVRFIMTTDVAVRTFWTVIRQSRNFLQAFQSHVLFPPFGSSEWLCLAATYQSTSGLVFHTQNCYRSCLTHRFQSLIFL